MAPEVLEQTDEEAAAEAAAALEADELAQRDAEADDRAQKAADLEAEQKALDAEDRQTPDRPEGAADEEPDAADRGEEPDDDGPSLAEELRQASGLAADHAEAQGQTQPDAGGELPGMPKRELTTDAGGAPPTASQFKLAGISLDLGSATQFKKGAATRFLIDVRWPEVDLIDKEDGETGQVTDTIRRHKGKIVHYEIVAVDEEG